MVIPISDFFKLQPSAPFTLDGHEEESVNLELQASSITSVGVVQGTILLPNGNPVPFATVQVYTSQGVPYAHVNSNPQGIFIIPNVPVGSYLITASEPGYLTPVRIPLTVTQGRPTQVSITLQPDPAATTGAMFGIVRNITNNEPVNNALVSLFQTDGTTVTPIGTVTSNASGQYLFAELPSGTYFVQAVLPGYLSNQSAPVTIQSPEYVPLDINLTADPNANTGTVSGIVTDQANGVAIPNALVALYTLTAGVEQIIQITRTNQGGLYLFGDLPPGIYRVKATVQVNTG
ncbi:carboxypeptidase-like regulatory domain-containing protein [Paenibacillus polymyxa]|uniref:MSCRAMM family protein n=1 Tax=Paenibacillus TaxID=44249 RepID=UPI000FA1DF7D|nr:MULTISPECIES: carboxypeptidase-like regulatory domain-containing protein [Paenibacillus]MCP3796346.1 carboxypeptidase-like regulatory domain-containing protein [Paenibacillus sp. CH40]MDY7994263.1 carboxypeptidase-like regulatory domain-containing protein [Paenibacillus polymyxa]MDY8120957.1 carboxypeptidase-like regulatory domain-containing protein [Paenibacillus polymyxa]